MEEGILAEQKLGELRAKVGGIGQELDWWTGESVRGEYLEKFNTRIRAVRVVLDEVADPLEARVNAVHGQRILELAPGLELSILEIHRVWEFFRAKLALRYVPWLAPYLLAADELAWRCYQPAIDHMDGVGREPPLVFLNGASSPFTMPRGTAYRAEEVPGEAISSEMLEQLLESLPIPVIGVPWFALQHLPDALVIAHEVGHDVEHDTGLADELDHAIRSAVEDPRRVQAWLSWRSEMFADAFGVLSTGPAFAGALMDFIARGPRFIATERRGEQGWGRYPTASLRVTLVLDFLRECEFTGDAEELERRWAGTYDQGAGADFADDVPAIAHALIATRYRGLGGRSLKDIQPFDQAMHELADKTARDALARRSLQAADARALIAAARLAYDRDGPGYVGSDVPARILRRVGAAQEVGVRGRGDAGPPRASRDARDQQSGRALATAIAQAHGLTTEFEPEEGDADVQAPQPD